MQPEQALNEVSQQYTGSYLEPYLPYLSQGHNLWNRMRRRVISSGFHTCEALRLEPAPLRIGRQVNFVGPASHFQLTRPLK